MRARFLTATTCVKRWQKGAAEECRDCGLALTRGATGTWKEHNQRESGYIWAGAAVNKSHRRNSCLSRMGKRTSGANRGAEIKRLRTEAGISANELARRLGWNAKGGLTKYECDRTGCTDAMWKRIVEACRRSA
jgi:DNA-binding transcriptional regulator YiaG